MALRRERSGRELNTVLTTDFWYAVNQVINWNWAEYVSLLDLSVHIDTVDRLCEIFLISSETISTTLIPDQYCLSVDRRPQGHDTAILVGSRVFNVVIYPIMITLFQNSAVIEFNKV